MRQSEPMMVIVWGAIMLLIYILIFFIALFLSSRAEAAYEPQSREYNEVHHLRVGTTPDFNRASRVRRYPPPIWYIIVPYRWIDPYPLYLRK